jgi:hypothetical protein
MREQLILVVAFHLYICSSAQVLDMELCREEESHFTFGGKNYVYSEWASDNQDVKKQTQVNGNSTYTGVVYDFGKAVEHCSKRCMGLLSLETEAEWLFIRDKMEEIGVPFIWTSGHKCDNSVDPKCYTTPSLQPRIVKGWFWSGSGAKIPDTDSTPSGWKQNPWGKTGIFTRVNAQNNPDAPPVPQPDNAEEELGLLKKKEESCLALATNLWEPGTVWNDIACYHQKPWICEDNFDLQKRAGL